MLTKIQRKHKEHKGFRNDEISLCVLCASYVIFMVIYASLLDNA